jgi:hypothetical protein
MATPVDSKDPAGTSPWQASRVRTCAVLGMTVIALLVVVGCGNSSPTAVTDAPASLLASAPGSSAAAPSPTPSAAATAAAAGNGCAPATVAVALAYAGDDGLYSLRELVFRNTSTSTCTLRGYPTVSLVTSSGSQVGPHAVRTSGTMTTVTLPPGARAEALLATYRAGSGTACTSTGQDLKVYLPGSSTRILVPAAYRICAGRFSVRPVTTYRGIGPGGYPVCTVEVTTIALGTSNSGAGHREDPLVLTNHSDQPCALQGTPTIRLYDATNHQIGVTSTGSGGTAPLVVLQPGQQGNAPIQTANPAVARGTCTATSASATVSLPGSNSSNYPIAYSYCSGEFDVGPFQAGAG